MVVVEDLQVSNMSRSAAGSIEQPGRNVRAKSGLNRSILDQGWAGFRRQLEYKMLWAGGLLLAVPPMNTSRTCPRCGHVSADNRRMQAEVACVACGFHENADLAGANLTNAALCGAVLSHVNLAGTNLFNADLAGADFAGANLAGANLAGANLAGAINVLRAGHARLACEVNGEVSRQQQEPSERAV